jgi:hypothetical protein
MSVSRLPELKKMLLHEKNLGTVWSFFMDHFAENSEFMALGEGARHTLVEAIVARVGKEMFSGPGTVRGLLLSRVPDQNFIHGGFSVDGRIGAIFYFEDIQTGLMSLAEGFSSDQVKFARFSGRMVRDPAPPSRN